MMSRRATSLLIAGAMLLVAAPRPAGAQGFVSPWFGGAVDKDPDDTGRASFGASVGSLSSADVFGFEIDGGYTPSFFGDESVGENSMFTLMASLVVGPSFETRRRKGVRPYGVFGIGVMHPKVAATSTNDFGWNAAGGVIGYLTEKIGIRFDARYFHSVDDTSAANPIQLKPGSLHFWRWSVGLVVR
jgi:outer membrane protein with beta-barrel domain